MTPSPTVGSATSTESAARKCSSQIRLAAWIYICGSAAGAIRTGLSILRDRSIATSAIDALVALLPLLVSIAAVALALHMLRHKSRFAATILLTGFVASLGYMVLLATPLSSIPSFQLLFAALMLYVAVIGTVATYTWHAEFAHSQDKSPVPG